MILLDIERAVFNMIKNTEPNDNVVDPVDRKVFNRLIDDWLYILENQGRDYTVINDCYESNEHWYEVRCKDSVVEWLENSHSDQEAVLWHRISHYRFKIHAKIFTLISLRWN